MNEIKEEFLRLKNWIYSNLECVDRSKYSYIQNYIYFAHYPIFSFAESVIMLCEKGKPKVAKVLLRTLFEVHIDVIYHQLGNKNQRLALSARRVFDERITILREIIDLIKKCPNLESQDPKNLFSKKYLTEAIFEQEERRDAVVKGNPSMEKIKKVHLFEKAKACDDEQLQNTEPGHFGKMYSLIYRQLSPVSHLNGEGLDEFMEEGENGKIVFTDADSGEFLASQAIKICIAFAKDLYGNQLLTEERTDSLVNLEQMLQTLPD